MIWRASTTLRLNANGLSLVREDREKRAPTSVVNALSEMVVLSHAHHVQVFNTYAAVALRGALGHLEMKVPSLATDLEVLVRDLAARLAAHL